MIGKRISSASPIHREIALVDRDHVVYVEALSNGNERGVGKVHRFVLRWPRTHAFGVGAAKILDHQRSFHHHTGQRHDISSSAARDKVGGLRQYRPTGDQIASESFREALGPIVVGIVRAKQRDNRAGVSENASRQFEL